MNKMCYIFSYSVCHVVKGHYQPEWLLLFQIHIENPAISCWIENIMSMLFWHLPVIPRYKRLICPAKWVGAYTKHGDAIKWKHFTRYWPFVRGIHWSPVNSPAQRPVTQSFDVFLDPCQNKRLVKQSWGWWFEMPSRSLWCHCNVIPVYVMGFEVSHGGHHQDRERPLQGHLWMEQYLTQHNDWFVWFTEWTNTNLVWGTERLFDLL